MNIPILIVDSSENCSLVALFNRAGYQHVKLRTDIFNNDDEDVLDSLIIYVRAKEVGKLMYAAEGAGLASYIKEKHRKKKVIVYDLDKPVEPVYRNIDASTFSRDEKVQFITLADRFVKEIFMVNLK